MFNKIISICVKNEIFNKIISICVKNEIFNKIISICVKNEMFNTLVIVCDYPQAGIYNYQTGLWLVVGDWNLVRPLEVGPSKVCALPLGVTGRM
jgi:hypothetical protein